MKLIWQSGRLSKQFHCANSIKIYSKYVNGSYSKLLLLPHSVALLPLLRCSAAATMSKCICEIHSMYRSLPVALSPSHRRPAAIGNGGVARPVSRPCCSASETTVWRRAARQVYTRAQSICVSAAVGLCACATCYVVAAYTSALAHTHTNIDGCNCCLGKWCKWQFVGGRRTTAWKSPPHTVAV